jgi:hypothetical protein
LEINGIEKIGGNGEFLGLGFECDVEMGFNEIKS